MVLIEANQIGKFVEGKAVYPELDIYGSPFDLPANVLQSKLIPGYFIVLPSRPLTGDESAKLDGIVEAVAASVTPNRSEPIPATPAQIDGSDLEDVPFFSETPSTPPPAPKLPKRGSNS